MTPRAPPARAAGLAGRAGFARLRRRFPRPVSTPASFAWYGVASRQSSLCAMGPLAGRAWTALPPGGKQSRPPDGALDANAGGKFQRRDEPRPDRGAVNHPGGRRRYAPEAWRWTRRGMGYNGSPPGGPASPRRGRRMGETSFDIRRMEELSLNAWPALKQVLYDGWVLRFADGYTRRSNSVNPLYAGSGSLSEKIRFCQGVYRAAGQPTVFKLTAASEPPALADALAAAGYREQARTSVQAAELKGSCERPGGRRQPAALVGPALGAMARGLHPVHRIPPAPPGHAWRRSCAASSRRPASPPSPKAGETCACGMGVLQGPWLGLFDIVTRPDRRRQGFGRQLVGRADGLGPGERGRAGLPPGDARQPGGVGPVRRGRVPGGVPVRLPRQNGPRKNAGEAKPRPRRHARVAAVTKPPGLLPKSSMTARNTPTSSNGSAGTSSRTTRSRRGSSTTSPSSTSAGPRSTAPTPPPATWTSAASRSRPRASGSGRARSSSWSARCPSRTSRW